MKPKTVYPVIWRSKTSDEEQIDAVFEDYDDAKKFTLTMNEKCGKFYNFTIEPGGSEYFPKRNLEPDDHCQDCNYDNPSCNSCLGS
jgi:hypothetical protein